MNNRLFAIGILATALAVVTPCMAFADNQSKVRCGVIAPLTGKAADWGIWLKGGIEIAQSKFTDVSTEFIYEDDQYLPSQAVTAIRKLVNVDKVNCLITVGSSTGLAIQAIAEEARIPMFTIAITPKVGANMNNVFRFYIPLARQIETIVKEVRRRGYKKIAILTSEHDANLPLTAGLIEKNVAEVVFDEQVSGDDQASATLALKMKAANPDAIFLNVSPPLPSAYSRRLREIGFKGEIFSAPTLESLNEVKAAQGALEGAWYITVDDARAGASLQEYEDKYKAKPGMVAVYAHDIVKILLTRPQSTEPISYFKSLQKIEGMAGDYGWNGKEFDIPAKVWVIRGDTFISQK